MSKNAPVLAATVALLLDPLAAAAGEDVIERCRDIGSDADRIACLEAAIRTGQTSSVDGEAETPTPALPRRAGEGGTAGAAAESELADAPGADRPDEQAATTSVAAAAEDVAALGAEQVAARNRTRENMEEGLLEASDLEVEKFETVGYRKLQVHLKNGQVWRQIRGDTQQIRIDLERNPTVTISESSLGGYRMRLDGIRRIVRVQRIR